MPDISLCSNHSTNGCKIKNTCRRFLETSKFKKDYRKYDYYANDCTGYLEAETDQTRRERISVEKQEFYQDNKN